MSLFIYGIGDNSRGPIFPDLLREFQISNSYGSLFFPVCAAAAVVNNVITMRWMERFGPYRTLVAYTILQLAAFLMLGFSPTYLWVLVGATVMGLSMGGLTVAQNNMAAQAAKPERRRQSISFLQCMYGGSSLLAPLIVSALYHWALPWRNVFLIAAAMSAFFLCGLVFMYSSQSAMGRDTSREVNLADTIDSPLAEGETALFALFAKGLPDHLIERVGSTPKALIAYYATLVSLYVVAEVALSSRMVLYARQVHKFSPEMANGALSIFFIGLFLGRLSLAIWKLPIQSRPAMIASALLSILTFSFGLLFSPWWLAATGFTMSIYYPCVLALIHEDLAVDRDYRHSHAAASIAASVTSWSVTAQCLSLVVMHFVLGAMSDLFGVRCALWEGPLMLVVLFALLIKHREICEKLRR